MATDTPYRLSIETSALKSRNYNIFVSCAGYDDSKERTLFAEARSLCEAGDEPLQGDDDAVRRLELEVEDARRLHIFIYVQTVKLPDVRVVRAVRPFDIAVEVSYADESLFSQRYSVSPWGGCSLNFEVERPL